MDYLPEFDTHCNLNRQKIVEHHASSILAAQFENIMHLFFLRTLILVGTVFLLKFDMCTINIFMGGRGGGLGVG